MEIEREIAEIRDSLKTVLETQAKQAETLRAQQLTESQKEATQSLARDVAR